jgi:hypothetical protein
VVSSRSRSGRESRTVRRCDAVAGWRAKYWDEGPDTGRR